MEDGTLVMRERGTPQGGVVSPILMNLFMHYTFDCWMQRTHSESPFARYADDGVVHCRSQKQAEILMQSIALRLEECGLMMHPEKSKIVYCKDSNRTKVYSQVQFTFLGFTFRPRKAINRQGQKFTGFLNVLFDAFIERFRLNEVFIFDFLDVSFGFFDLFGYGEIVFTRHLFEFDITG